MSASTSPIRVRFAPSPTGALHLGGARTALFNFLFARHHGGKFIVRIEDTDRVRSTKESEDEIFSSMAWLGMESDEPVQRQTERTARYAAAASELLASGGAYRCYCTSEMLQRDREAAEAAGSGYRYPGTCRELTREPAPGEPFVIRLKVPTAEPVEVDDLVKGRVVFSSDDVDDWILARSDGTPTYNFTVVVDDSDMGISHVIRGDDHLSNTPKQVLLYRAMGRPLPAFAHVSMILGADKTRLSKRHGATSVRSFRDDGMLSSAMVNYLVRLGWAHGDQELFTLDELIRHFDLDGVNASAAVFNPEKLLWVNQQHLKDLSGEALLDLVLDHASYRYGGREGQWDSLWADRDYSLRVMDSLKTRARTLEELLESSRFFFEQQVSFEPGLFEKFFAPDRLPLFGELRSWLDSREGFSATVLESDLRAWCEGRGVKLGDAAQPLRVALTGRKASPPIFQVVEILGRERTLARLEAAAKRAAGS